MHEIKRTARLAGFLYLLVVLTGPFVLLYVPGKLFVSGDASATVSNILEHQTLVRVHILVGIASQFLFIASVLVFYRLFKGVSVLLANLMAVSILVIAPLGFAGIANEVVALSLARDPGFLAVFDKPQRDAMATLLLHFDQHSVAFSELFWGLWLFPLAALVYRSRFVPRLIGVWLFLNGLAYVVISLTGLFLPEHHKAVTSLSTPLLFGEVGLMLWLLIVGARGPGVAAAVPKPGGA